MIVPRTRFVVALCLAVALTWMTGCATLGKASAPQRYYAAKATYATAWGAVFDWCASSVESLRALSAAGEDVSEHAHAVRAVCAPAHFINEKALQVSSVADLVAVGDETPARERILLESIEVLLGLSEDLRHLLKHGELPVATPAELGGAL